MKTEEIDNDYKVSVSQLGKLLDTVTYEVTFLKKESSQSGNLPFGQSVIVRVQRHGDDEDLNVIDVKPFGMQVNPSDFKDATIQAVVSFEKLAVTATDGQTS